MSRKAINRAWQHRYNDDATFQMSQLRGNHPVRNVLHMQCCYPETVRRLNDKKKSAAAAAVTTVAGTNTYYCNSNGSRSSRRRSRSSNNNNDGDNHHLRRNNSRDSISLLSASSRCQPSATTSTNVVNGSGRRIKTSPPNNCTPLPPQQSPPSSAPPINISSSSRKDTNAKVRVEKVSVETKQRVANEFQFCRAKMAHNRIKGREAEVDGILTGKSPLLEGNKKMPLFPARATHQQLLGLVRRPSHPDKPAPKAPEERKWLGDNIGWEGERPTCVCVCVCVVRSICDVGGDIGSCFWVLSRVGCSDPDPRRLSLDVFLTHAEQSK